MIAGLATLILIVMLAGTVLQAFSGMKANSASPFKAMGKAGIGILAAKEFVDIVTQNNKTGIGSGGVPYNPGDSKYGQKPY